MVEPQSATIENRYAALSEFRMPELYDQIFAGKTLSLIVAIFRRNSVNAALVKAVAAC